MQCSPFAAYDSCPSRRPGVRVGYTRALPFLSPWVHPMTLVDGLDEQKLIALEVRFRDRLGNQTPGTKGHWIWTGNVLQVRYCRMQDLTSSLVDHALAGFGWLDACSPLRRPVVLFELWRVVWQTGSQSLINQAAEATDATEGAWWESRLYADFVLRRTLPVGPPPVKDMGAALLVPPEEAYRCRC
jgi:hypothetical protein